MGKNTPKKSQPAKVESKTSSPAGSPAPSRKSRLDAQQTRLESLLSDFARLRRTWNALVLVEGLKVAQRIIRGRQEALYVCPPVLNSGQSRMAIHSTSARRATVPNELQELYLARSMTKVEEDCCKLATVIMELVSSQLFHNLNRQIKF